MEQPVKEQVVTNREKKELAVSMAWFRKQEAGDALFNRVLNRMEARHVAYYRRRLIIGAATFTVVVAALVAAAIRFWPTDK